MSGVYSEPPRSSLNRAITVPHTNVADRARRIETLPRKLPGAPSRDAPLTGLPCFRERPACAILSIAVWGSRTKLHPPNIVGNTGNRRSLL